MTSCALHYDVIYHPLPINSQYLKSWGVDSPVSGRWGGGGGCERDGDALQELGIKAPKGD